MKTKKLITIVGPTAIGKTSLAIELAKKIGCEIISADSRQFFKEISIGTAKPTPEEMDGIPHHFIDFLPLEELYTAGKYEKDVLNKLEELFKKNEYAILVGGSGLYVNAVLTGIDDIPSDLTIREELNSDLKERGMRFLQRKLQELDPEHYEKMDIRNPQRLIRAIEVCLVTGKKYSELRTKEKAVRPFNIIQIGLESEREVIYNRINTRVDTMVKEGLIDEVKSLIDKKHLNSLNTVGYKELFNHFDDKHSLEFAIEKIKQNTRNFAKRQMTWFKKNKETKWFQREEMEQILNYIQDLKN